ncbi:MULTISPECIES: hypothetical protein [unclassified Pantoea]|uniref:hypothetical protein n=1 Tax=unclassified Pantoea TaxID=2630326 RepID=UPI00301BCA1A
MKITHIMHGEQSVLVIRSSLLHLLKHARVAGAALDAAPDAEVATTGVFWLKTVLTGKASDIEEARKAARLEEMH